MKTTVAMVTLLWALSAASQNDCPIDGNNQPLNPACPHISVSNTTYLMKKNGAMIKFMTAGLTSPDIHIDRDGVETSVSSNKATAWPYIPLFEDCNLPTSKNDPGLCDVAGEFKPNGIWAQMVQLNKESYLKREITPYGVNYHYSSEHISNPTSRDKVIIHEQGYKVEGNRHHLVIDYLHYRLDGPPIDIKVNKSDAQVPRTGVIEIEFDGVVLKGCNKPDDGHTNDPNKTILVIKSAGDEHTHEYHVSPYFIIQQWGNDIYYKVTNENAGFYTDPNLIVCQDYLTDDIFKGKFEDEIYKHGFDDRPWPFYAPAYETGSLPPRP